MSLTRRKEKKGRRSRKNEILPFFKTMYQRGGATITWTSQGTFSVTAIAGSSSSINSTITTTPKSPQSGNVLLRAPTEVAAAIGIYNADGVGSQAVLCNTIGIDADSAGNVILLEPEHQGGGYIRLVKPDGTVKTLTYSHQAADGKFDTLSNKFYDSGIAGLPLPGGVTVNAPAGNFRGGTYQAYSVAVNKANDVFYFPEYAHHHIRAAVADDGNTFSGRPTDMKRFVGGGTADAPNTEAAAGMTTIIYSKFDTNSGRTDGLSKNIRFVNPYSITVDPRGTRMYIAESSNNIRMVDIINSTSYYVSTLYTAANPINSMTVDSNGNLYFTMDSKHAIWKIVPPAANTRTTGANANPLLASSGAVIFAGSEGTGDYIDNTATVTGLTNARFNDPRGIAVDSANNIYVADRANNVIRVIVSATGQVNTFAGNTGGSTSLDSYANKGDGPNNFSRFSNPFDVAVSYGSGQNGSDVVYVLDGGDLWDPNRRPNGNSGSTNNAYAYARIRRLAYVPPPSVAASFAVAAGGIDPISATFTWATGTGITGQEAAGYAASFYFLIKETATSAETRVDFPANAGNIIPFTPLLSNVVAASGQQGYYINNIVSLPLTPNTTYASIKLVGFNLSGSNASAAITNLTIPPTAPNYTWLMSGTVGTPGYSNGLGPFARYKGLRGAAVASNGDIYVVDYGNNCIRVIGGNSGISYTYFGTPPYAGPSSQALNSPSDITFGATGDFPLYVCDAGNNRVLSIDSSGIGTILATTGIALESPTGMTVDPNGNLYVSSNSKHCIYKINSSGVVSLFAGKNGTAGSADGANTINSFKAPTDITYDPVRTCIYVADTGNHLIRFIGFDSANTSYTLAGSAGLNGIVNGFGSVARFNTPTGVATDMSGNVYVSDSLNHCIRKITQAGLVSVYSGTAGMAGFADGTSTPTTYNSITTTVKYSQPYGIFKMPTGSFVVTDTGNSCLRILTSVAPPTAPTSIQLAAVGTNTATIAWSGDTGATSYGYGIYPYSMYTDMPTTTSSPATFGNLVDSSQFSMLVAIIGETGIVYSSIVKCTTSVDISQFVVTVPIVECLPLQEYNNDTATVNTSQAIANATIRWTGITDANTITYTLSPGDMNGTTTGTFPPNQKSPYTLRLLTANTTFTIKLSATFNDVPGINGGAATSATVDSSTVTFSTGPPKPSTVAILAGDPTKTGKTVVPAIPSNAALLTSALNGAKDIIMDNNGALFVACRTCIVKIDPPTDRLYTVEADGFTPNLLWPTPHSLTKSQISMYAGTGDGGNLGGAPNNTVIMSKTGQANISFYNLGGIAYDRNTDTLYVNDSQLHIIIKIVKDVTGAVTASIFAGAVGDRRHVPSTVATIAPVLTPPATGSLASNQTDARFDSPVGLTVGPDSSVYVTSWDHTVKKIFNGKVALIADSMASPHGICVLPDNTVLVVSSENGSIYKLTPVAGDTTGAQYTKSLYAGTGSSGWASGSLLQSQFDGPISIYATTEGDLYVYDAVNGRIRYITGGMVFSVIGDATNGSDNTPPGTYNLSAVKIQKYSGRNLITGDQAAYLGITGDANGNIYFCANNNGNGDGATVRGLIPKPPPTVDQAFYDSYVRVQGASQAVRMAASTALRQAASTARRLSYSSAQQQQASMAVVRQASSAMQQRASSATRQQASMAQVQQASTALVQRASSAMEQQYSAARPLRESTAMVLQASSASFQSMLAPFIAVKDNIKNAAYIPTQTSIAQLKRAIYAPGGNTAQNFASLTTLLNQFANARQALIAAGADIFRLSAGYQDSTLQIVVNDSRLAGTGIRNVFDILRNAHIYLDANNNIVNSPYIAGQHGGSKSIQTRKVKINK